MQSRALFVLLFALLAGLLAMFLRQGRTVEEGFRIVGQSRATPAPSTVLPSPPNAGPAAREAVPAPKEIVVHVAGAVQKPGVYHLKPETRAEEAVQAAGGAKPEANLDVINLAARVEDGQQLYVPTRQESPVGGAPGAGQKGAQAADRGTSTPHRTSHGNKLASPGQGTVNLNTATVEELERLPGVGPAIAARIVAFRKENGPFTSPEGLMDVSGIGEKKFEKMQPFVRVR